VSVIPSVLDITAQDSATFPFREFRVHVIDEPPAAGGLVIAFRCCRVPIGDPPLGQFMNL
jgi:hypothetical protein